MVNMRTQVLMNGQSVSPRVGKQIPPERLSRSRGELSSCGLSSPVELN
ncbi:MAG: hypothetical protein POELPBGB_03644 [Bacteroidia bacterium]|nr:hypothetical protein [Bacteroidia bacterium]